jgi:hypothetical protein
MKYDVRQANSLKGQCRDSRQHQQCTDIIDGAAKDICNDKNLMER